MNETRPIVVEVREVRKRFGAHTVLDGVSVEVLRGETVVVLGGSGEGKSVLPRNTSTAFSGPTTAA